MESWPTVLPTPSAAFDGDVQANTIRTQMESGVFRQRSRFTADLIFSNVTWELDDLQMSVFAAFHKYRLNLGNDWFEISLPLGGGMQTHVVRLVDGKFKQTYVPVAHWSVTAQLEIRERVTLPSDILDAYITIGFVEEDLTNFLDAIEDAYTVTHTTIPSYLI